MKPAVLLLLTHALATCFMVGLIWFVQVVHYPLFSSAGAMNPADYRAYHDRHTRLTTLVVGPAMLVEALAAAALVLQKPSPLRLTALALLLGCWLSTALVSVPLHQKLITGYDPATAHQLVHTNWPRTILWTARGLIALALIPFALPAALSSAPPA
ncbi:MAG: hypothetical protein AAF108_07560 [Planctomycetota bacterium]